MTPAILAPERAAFLRDVVAGLSSPRKSIPCKYFYDERGSELFEEITRLPEYYPTRTEQAILERHAGEMATAVGPGAVLIEYGSGASVKTRILLDALQDLRAYIPIDISEAFLLAVADQIRVDYGSFPVLPVPADYTASYVLPALPPHRRIVAFFPGSTIGNFEVGQARQFLRNTAIQLGEGGGLLIGVDLRKEASILEQAYDDSQGVTAAFNMNLLERIGAELDGDVNVERFRHVAVWNPDAGRVEMYLESLDDQEIAINGHRFHLKEGERIHTENSHKYTVEGFAELASSAGFRPVRYWMDEDELFSVHYLETSGF